MNYLQKFARAMSITIFALFGVISIWMLLVLGLGLYRALRGNPLAEMLGGMVLFLVVVGVVGVGILIANFWIQHFLYYSKSRLSRVTIQYWRSKAERKRKSRIRAELARQMEFEAQMPHPEFHYEPRHQPDQEHVVVQGYMSDEGVDVPEDSGIGHDSLVPDYTSEPPCDTLDEFIGGGRSEG